MWFLIDIVASRYSPRFFTVATGLISARPMIGLLVGCVGCFAASVDFETFKLSASSKYAIVLLAI